MRKAFTLIELLVVVAVIAVLAALLFPAFAKARRRALSTQCISQMRQIGIAVQEYVDDWDGRYPYAHTAESAYLHRIPRNVPGWYDLLDPYIRNQKTLRCPCDAGETYPADPLSWGQPTPPWWQWLVTSYDYPGLTWMGVVLAGRPRSRVPRPVLAPLVVELRPWHSDYNRRAYAMRQDPAPEHVIHCDGHFARRTMVGWEQDQYDAYRRGQ